MLEKSKSDYFLRSTKVQFVFVFYQSRKMTIFFSEAILLSFSDFYIFDEFMSRKKILTF